MTTWEPVDDAKLENDKNFVLEKLSIPEGLPQFNLRTHVDELQGKEGLPESGDECYHRYY